MSTTVITLDVALFRQMYPQFADDSKFSDELIEMQFGSATVYVSDKVGCEMPEAARRQALYLMTAHLLALNVIIAQNSYQGQPGIVSAASVDKVSVTLQPPPETDQWAWWLNNTPYGAQLIALLKAQSAAGFYIGGFPETSGFRRAYGIFK